MDIHYLTKISDVIRRGISTQLDVFDFANSLSDTQLRSKQWLVNTLTKQTFKKNPNILILGGWYGSYLVPLLEASIRPNHIFFNDIDPLCLKFAAELHKDKDISFHCFDATVSYSQRFDADIVINTSCEHMSSYHRMFCETPEALFVLQTCDNNNDPGHVNTSHSTEDFVKKLSMSSLFFNGRMNFGHKNRFMVIGKP